MRMDKYLQPKLVLTVGVALLLLPAMAGAAGVQPTAQSQADVLAALEAVPSVAAPAVDIAAVTREDEVRARQGLAPRFAIPNATSLTPETDGLWEQLDDSTLVWRLRVTSPGAKSLNLGFTHFFMPDGAQMMIYASDFSQVIRPVTAADNAAHGEFWSPIVEADEVVVEVTLPATERDALDIELTSLNVGYRGFGKAGGDKSGSCNIDVVCPEGDGWRDEIPSVAVISTGGSLFCTGFMVNNTAEDETPYFMTAYHCGIRSNNAGSLVTYWNYETSTCGGNPNGSLSDWQSGSFFRSEYSASDFTLVEMDSDPDPAWGVTFAGWSRSSADASGAIAIHHPSVDEKRISFENDATTTTSYLSNTVPGNGTHIRVIDWDLGTTEGGSSGSPLFDPNHRVIGQLHGGYASCSSQTSDWYGRISVSWTGGGSNSTRLSNWLDAGGTGAVTVNTLVPGAGFCGDGTCGSGEDECNCPSDCAGTCVCDNNGTCDGGEDCNNCSNDCFAGSGASCGNGICEAGDGEDCVSCAADCNGRTGGKPANRFCCGDGDGQNPRSCSDSSCSSGGWSCTDTPAAGSCCGDGTCEGSEDGNNCAIDCSCQSPADCNDGVACTDDDCVGGFCENVANDANCSDDGQFCNGAEYCSASAGCSSTGDPCGSGETCNEGTDTCDACTPKNGSCSTGAECCSGTCKNNGRCR